MEQAIVDTELIKRAVELASRAPSLHNSQPWRWVADGDVLHLFADPSRIGHGSDHTRREVLISCGAVLDHFRAAMTAAGWQTRVDKFPNPNNRDHLATLDFRRAEFVTDAHRARAKAISRRRTDRLPFAAPADWDSFEPVLRATIDDSLATLDVLADGARPQLADASRRTEQLRRYDTSYQAELQWWTTQSESAQGIPPGALLSEEEAQRVDVARAFPRAGDITRRAELDRDYSKILVLSTYDDSRRCVLGCGEVLSTVLLECTMAGLATCTLTHMIELAASRDIVRLQTGRLEWPQLLIRVGVAPQPDSPPPPTRRRSATDVLEIRS